MCLSEFVGSWFAGHFLLVPELWNIFRNDSLLLDTSVVLSLWDLFYVLKSTKMTWFRSNLLHPEVNLLQTTVWCSFHFVSGATQRLWRTRPLLSCTWDPRLEVSGSSVFCDLAAMHHSSPETTWQMSNDLGRGDAHTAPHLLSRSGEPPSDPFSLWTSERLTHTRHFLIQMQTRRSRQRQILVLLPYRNLCIAEM